MRTIHLAAWGTLIITLALWGGFGFLVWNLYGERADYAQAESSLEEDALRGESAARLHAMVQDTESARASLESLPMIGILDAVEMIETTGKRAGAASISIGEATPAASSNVPKGLTAYSIVVNTAGSFSAIVRTMSLFETLTIPAVLERFEMEGTGKSWKSTAHLKVLVSSTP